MTLASLFDAVVRLSWQAALLVAAVLLVQWLARRRLPASWRYNLWLLVIIRLLLPISAQSPLSVFNVVKLPAPTPAVRMPAPALFAPRLPAPAAVAPSAPVAPRVATRPRPAPIPRSTFDWRRALTLGWLAGAAALSMYIGWNTALALWKIRAARPIAEPTIDALFASCCRQMKIRAQVAVLETSLVKSPALFGVFRPRLLLPPGLLEQFTPAELRYVLLHELAHVRRRDVAANWLLTLLQTIHWFNPVIWFGFARMRADRELACDALAMACSGEEEAQSYGLTIIKLLETFSRSSPVPGLVGILENKNQMAHRIRRIAGFRRGRRRSVLAIGLMAALAAVGLTDAVRSTRGQNSKAPASTKTIHLTVLDAETGLPIAGARVIPGFSRAIYYTGDLPVAIPVDATGAAVIPAQSFGVTAPGYASRAAQWFNFANESPAVIPTDYTMKLERGGVIGGTLRDEAGQPLGGVRVGITGICDPRLPDAAPQKQEEYPFYDPTFNPGAVTDAQGRWTCANFSPQMEVLQLDFQREDGSLARFHTAIAGWKYTEPGGELIEMAAARRGDLVCVFKRGVDVRGSVQDAAGRPLAGVKVTETDRRHLRGPVSVSETGADGRFLLPGRDPHQVQLTLSGAGLAINARVVTIVEGMPEVVIPMHPAAGLRLRVMDAAGNAIAGARINPMEPRLNYSFAGDVEGRVSWPEAPVEPVAYAIYAAGYGPRTIKLAATGAEQTITLRKGDPPGSHWSVRAIGDDGQPLDRFTVSASYWVNGADENTFAAPKLLGEGKAGLCEVIVPSEQSNLPLRLKIEAPGLDPYLSEKLSSAGEQERSFQATLHRAGEARVRLLLPNGQPAAGATLAVKDMTGADSTYIELNFYSAGKPRIEGKGLKRVTADVSGNVSLPAATADAPLIAVHEGGYFFARCDGTPRSGEVRLNPWGRIEGTLTLNGRPVASQRLQLAPNRDAMTLELLTEWIVVTDHEGHFVFERVPAGDWTLQCTKVSKGEWPQYHSMKVTATAGGVTSLAYAVTGRTVTGKVNIDPASAAIDWKKDLGNCLLTLKQAATPDRRGNAPAFHDFMSRDDYMAAERRYFETHRYAPETMHDTYMPEFDQDGTFRIEGVPPGDYEFSLELARRLGALKRLVSVPAGPAETAVPLEAMDLTLADDSVPRKPVLDFTAAAFDGQPVKLADYRGKYVIVVFWAAWAPPPAEQIAEWKTLMLENGKNPRFALLAVSLDPEAAPAREFAAAHELPGVQCRLEGAAKAAVAEALGVNELPTTLFLDPKGQLLLRDLPADRMQAAVRAALPELK